MLLFLVPLYQINIWTNSRAKSPNLTHFKLDKLQTHIFEICTRGKKDKKDTSQDESLREQELFTYFLQPESLR